MRCVSGERGNITDDAKGVIGVVWHGATLCPYPPYAPTMIMSDTSIIHMLSKYDACEYHDVFCGTSLFEAIVQTDQEI